MLIECQYCGSEFEAERSSAKYCSDSHKTLANRERRHLEAIEYERQLQQAELDETISRIEENRKRIDKQAAAELSERIRVADEERKQYKEQQTIKDENRRQDVNDRRRVECERSAERADLKLKLTGIGIISAFGLMNFFLNQKSVLNKNSDTPAVKQPNPTTNKVFDNHIKDESTVVEPNPSEKKQELPGSD